MMSRVFLHSSRINASVLKRGGLSYGRFVTKNLSKTIDSWSQNGSDKIMSRPDEKLLDGGEIVAGDAEKDGGKVEETPWYLRDDSASPLVASDEAEVPQAPAGAPAAVGELLGLVAQEYGMEEVEVFDMTKLDELHESNVNNQPAKYIIIGTGKSEKHIFKAANELRYFIKHRYSLLPRVEGAASNSMNPTLRRRIKKRNKKGPVATDKDYGKVPNSWVMCDTLKDDIFIHFLSKERRDELRLEELWCEPHELDKYSRSETAQQKSDDIFIGIRRFHTQTLFAKNHRQNHRNFSTELVSKSDEILSAFANLKIGVADAEILKLLNQFGNETSKTSLVDLQNGFYLLRNVHLIRPDLVSFEQVVEALLAKYAALDIMVEENLELTTQRVHDTVEFMKLLLDSPQVAAQCDKLDFKSIQRHCDSLLHELAQFSLKIYKFVDAKIELSSHPEFVPLLWRLSYVESGPHSPIGLDTINRVVYRDGDIPNFPPEPTIVQASNRARDIIDLINHQAQTSTESTTKSPTNPFHDPTIRELISITYGNAGQWDKFWTFWQNPPVIQDSNGTPREISISHWVRLVVYLAARNDVSAITNFLNRYWDKSFTKVGSFIDSFTENGKTFNSDEEKTAFLKAMKRMISLVNQGNHESIYTHVQDFLARHEDAQSSHS